MHASLKSCIRINYLSDDSPGGCYTEKHKELKSPGKRLCAYLCLLMNKKWPLLRKKKTQTLQCFSQHCGAPYLAVANCSFERNRAVAPLKICCCSAKCLPKSMYLFQGTHTLIHIQIEPHISDILQSAACKHIVFWGSFNFSVIQNTKKCIFSALIVRIQNYQQCNGP